ncbi:MAG: hypothetical protein AAF456_18520 [Planctomycetota bacterium]
MFKQPPIVEYLAVQGLGYAYNELMLIRHHAASLQRRERELNMTLEDIESKYLNSTHKCPVCSEPMIDMGLDFKPPRSSDTKAWRNLRGLYRVGHVFHTCGCDGPGWIPVSTSEFKDYLLDRRQRYSQNLAGVQQSTELNSEQKFDGANFWQSRVDAINSELEALPMRNS